jgi:hypothetical protein
MMRDSHFDTSAQRALARARRLTLVASRSAISSREILAACLDDTDVERVLDRAGLSVKRLRDRLVPAAIDEGAGLLAMIGVDAAEVRRKLPPAPSAGLSLRRSVIRPLRITVGEPPARTPFAGSGRKVLEVAVWTARRNGRRQADAIDLLLGIVADAADPVRTELADASTDGTGLRRLLTLDPIRL